MRRTVLACIGAAALSGCTSGQVGVLPVSQANYNQTKLEFSIGYATGYDFSLSNGATPSYGLNIVESFRGANGRSAVQNDISVVTIPQSLVKQTCCILITDPPTGGNDGGTANQLVRGLGPAFGAGFGTLQTTQTYSNSAAFGSGSGWGGPPAFPYYQAELPPQSYGSLNLYSEGYTTVYPLNTQNGTLGITQAQAVQNLPGTYSLNVYIPNVPNAGSIETPGSNYTIKSASATLKGAPLPLMPKPAFAFDGKGGGTLTATIPAGVTETEFNIAGDACALPGTYTTPVAFNSQLYAPAVYTFLSEVPGPATVTILVPDQIGPVGASTGQAFRTLCLNSDLAALNFTGIPIVIQAAGFDYPAYESVYPNNFSEAPPLSGPNGQSDITLSDVLEFNYYP